MDSTLLPAIGELEKDSLCYSIYAQLYNNFFNAQDSGTVVEGDWISIRLHSILSVIYILQNKKKPPSIIISDDGLEVHICRLNSALRM